MRRFKRSTHCIVTVTLFIIVIYYILKYCLVIAYLEEAFNNTDLVKLLFFFMAWAIAMIVIPPDFKYFVNTKDDYIIFEMSEDEHVRINKDFIIVNKGIYYLVLDDGFSRISIAYNKDLLHFLMNEIN